MKRIVISLAISALAYLNLAGVASAAGANDRTYFPTISPASAAPGQTQAYVLSVTNYSQNLCQTCTPLHFIQQIKITVPAGFTLVTPQGAAGPVSTEPNWQVQSIAGSPQVITIVTSGFSLVVGKTVHVTINAKYTGTINGCVGSVSPTWNMDVNQAVAGGVGNTYGLAPGASYPKITVAATECLTQTNLALSMVTSNGNQTIRTTDTSATVTLTATLTKADTNAAVAGEPVTFNLGGGSLTTCSGLTTNSSGVAVCTFSPQLAPYTPLGAGAYNLFASFAGDAAPTPDLGGSTSESKVLTVNADGTGIAVDDASGTYGGTVDLRARLTSQAGTGIAGVLVTFFVNGTQAGPAVTTDGSGYAVFNGASTAGIGAGPHENYIKASFAGDATYGAVEGLAKLTLAQQSSSIGLSNLTQVYTGAPLSPTVTTNPGGLAYTWSVTAPNVSVPQTSAGSYPVVATLTDPNYLGGSASGTFIIAPATVTAVITAANKVYDANNTASITTCTVVGLAAVDAGKVGCTASGTFASVNVSDGIVVTATSVNLSGPAAGNYQILLMPQTNANITKAGSSVTVTGGTFVYNNAAHPATGLAATSAGSLTNPSAVTISYSGSCSSAPTTVSEGTACTATGNYPGDANHAGSSNTAAISITKAGSSVTVTGGSFPYDGAPHAAAATAGTTAGSLALPAVVNIAYTGGCTSAPVTVAEGTSCTATGTYDGDDNHTGSSNTASVTITKATQAITYTSFTVNAAAPGGTVIFSSGSPSVCSVTQLGAVTILGPGNCVIVANQPGGDNYQAAPQRTDQVVKQ